MDKEIDTYGINTIICPHCGYERDSTWDDNEDGLDFEEHEFYCDECEETFLADCTMHVDYVFLTKKYEEDYK